MNYNNKNMASIRIASMVQCNTNNKPHFHLQVQAKPTAESKHQGMICVTTQRISITDRF